jgi:hypothetical protein
MRLGFPFCPPGKHLEDIVVMSKSKGGRTRVDPHRGTVDLVEYGAG